MAHDTPQNDATAAMATAKRWPRMKKWGQALDDTIEPTKDTTMDKQKT